MPVCTDPPPMELPPGYIPFGRSIPRPRSLTESRIQPMRSLARRRVFRSGERPRPRLFGWRGGMHRGVDRLGCRPLLLSARMAPPARVVLLPMNRQICGGFPQPLVMGVAGRFPPQRTPALRARRGQFRRNLKRMRPQPKSEPECKAVLSSCPLAGAVNVWPQWYWRSGSLGPCVQDPPNAHVCQDFEALVLPINEGQLQDPLGLRPPVTSFHVRTANGFPSRNIRSTF